MFARQVANEVEGSKPKEDAFVFGLSGQWGEGKTYFLNDLEKHLRKKNFQVIKLSPWKYAHDDNSLLRELLKKIEKHLNNPVNSKKHSFKMVTNWPKRKMIQKNIDSLYEDITSNKINLKRLLIVAFLILALIIIYALDFALLEGVEAFITQHSTPIILLLIPVFIGISNAVITKSTSSKSVSTRDEFDNVYDEIIRYKNFNDRFVVYVDDLDRLSAEKALLVLDNLRTFFDKKQMIFIVASDHTVLERHLGRALMPDGKSGEQLQEGRRYMKKIFNVYWRLPLPTKPEFESYIDELTSKENNEFLYSVLINNDNRNKFHEHLSNYFSNNFRNVERFIERTVFTFRLIESMKNSKKITEEDKKIYEEMLGNPLLVVRILLIEDLANPLYEHLQHNPHNLMTIEKKGGEIFTDDSNDEFDLNSLNLSDRQKTFLMDFIPKSPKFYEDNVIKVRSISPYIHLTSDPSFGDSRGLDPEKFAIELVENQNTKTLAEIVEQSGSQKIKDASRQLIEKIENTEDQQDKLNLLSNLSELVMLLDNDLENRRLLTNVFTEISFGFVAQLNDSQKTTVYVLIDRISFGDKQLAAQMGEILPNLPTQEMNIVDHIPADHSAGTFLADKLLEQLIEYHSRNANDAVVLLAKHIDRFEEINLGERLETITPQLISDYIADNNESRRECRIKLLSKTGSGVSKLKNHLEETLTNNPEPHLYNHLYQNSQNEGYLFSEDELVKIMLDALINSEDPNHATRYFKLLNDKTPHRKGEIWQKIIENDKNAIYEMLHSITPDNQYSSISPSNTDANRIAQKIISAHVHPRMNDRSAHSWLARVERNIWLFLNLEPLKTSTKRLIENKLSRQYIDENNLSKEQLEKILKDFSVDEN